MMMEMTVWRIVSSLMAFAQSLDGIAVVVVFVVAVVVAVAVLFHAVVVVVVVALPKSRS